MAGGKVVYVPLRPPPNAESQTSSAADWTIDMNEVKKAMTERTKMIVSCLNNCILRAVLRLICAQKRS